MHYFLRDNSPEILQKIRDAGIKTCRCCEFKNANWLDYYTSVGDVHGIYPDVEGEWNQGLPTTWEEYKEYFLSELESDSIDCETDVDLFIKLIKDGK